MFPDLTFIKHRLALSIGNGGHRALGVRYRMPLCPGATGYPGLNAIGASFTRIAPVLQSFEGTFQILVCPLNMASALDPTEIFGRAADEGKRRLDQSLAALLATGFIAGFTVIFGIVAQALIESAAEPHFREFASVLGALGFGVGIMFLILGRAELFSENFFDPIATAFEGKESHVSRRLIRLWVFTFALNIVGGALLIGILSVEGALPNDAQMPVVALAQELAKSAPWATFARSVVGGALVALLSFLVIAAQSSGTRAAMALAVGFLLALGPFEHVVVALLHMQFGWFLGADITGEQIAKVGAISLAGNFLGGIGLVTLSHAAQALGNDKDQSSRRSST